MNDPITHRGIVLIQSDHPSRAITWSHEGSGSGGVAHTTQEAIRQISIHLGPDPDCRTCLGHGAEDFNFLAYLPCPVCFPEDLE